LLKNELISKTPDTFICSWKDLIAGKKQTTRITQPNLHTSTTDKTAVAKSTFYIYKQKQQYLKIVALCLVHNCSDSITYHTKQLSRQLHAVVGLTSQPLQSLVL